MARQALFQRPNGDCPIDLVRREVPGRRVTRDPISLAVNEALVEQSQAGSSLVSTRTCQLRVDEHT